MDFKEVIDKVIDGQDVTELTKDYDDQTKIAYNVALKKATDEAARTGLASVVGLRAEAKRLEDKKKELEGDKNTVSQFRSEQVQKAKARLLSDPKFPLTDAEKVSFDELFAKLDSGKVDADLIFQDLTRTYAALKSDSLISAGQRVTEMEKNAAEFSAQGANATGGGLSQADVEKYSPEARTLYLDWQRAGFKGKAFTLDAATKQLTQGNRRKL